MSESKLESASIEMSPATRISDHHGPRIVGLYSKHKESNLLAETPDVHWETAHGDIFAWRASLVDRTRKILLHVPEEGLSIIEETRQRELERLDWTLQGWKGDHDPCGRAL